MRNKIIFCFILLLISNYLYAQLTVSGVLDSTVSLNAGAGDAPAFSYGIEEFANIRFQSKLRDYGAVYGAVNLIAASGDYAKNLASTGVSTGGENFAAAIELERLYFRLSGEYTNFDFGLMRIPFGFGQVWGSSDFLNPRNPLKPDARPRAVLGTVFSWFPVDEIKLLLFFASAREAFANEGEGSLAGISFDKHWDKASVQVLYSFEAPKTGSDLGIHRAGLSAKADIEVGLFIDALYTYNHQAETRLDGLSFSAGADYSFFDGSLIILAEYLYNGESSSTSINDGGSFFNNHYLYTGFTYRFNDFTNMSLAVISGLDDVSFTPVISINHDLFQGAVLTITAQVPLDRDLFLNDGNRGELGPIRPDKYQPHTQEGILIGRYGSYFNCTARIRLRF